MLIDTHAHVTDPQFDADRDDVLARAREGGVEAIVNVGIDLDSCRRTVELASRNALVFAAIGIHPYDGDKVDGAVIGELRALAASPRVVALGETGLDFFRERSTRAGQMRSLRLHLDLCAELSLPVILHLRSSETAGAEASDAYEACIDVLEEYRGRVRGVSHCFSATLPLAERLVGLEFMVSFACNVTYKKATVLRETARALPLRSILIETDAPYLAPEGRRGKRNEPAYVRAAAEAIAASRGMPVDALCAATADNARRLFGLCERSA